MKKIVALLLCAAFLCPLAACGGGEETVSLDVTALAAELAAADLFDDIITEIPAAAAERFYGYEAADVTACALYQSTAAAAEEVFVAECAGSEALARVKAGAEARIEEQIASYENYVPAEVPKLESAILMTEGNTLIFVVCADYEGAQSILDSYLG